MAFLICRGGPGEGTLMSSIPRLGNQGSMHPATRLGVREPLPRGAQAAGAI